MKAANVLKNRLTTGPSKGLLWSAYYPLPTLVTV